uniref:Uncharacterized protein n=1 Tax=Arundo donax TaxID=35708 RepID=A0A0A8ZX24_ARUDO
MTRESMRRAHSRTWTTSAGTPLAASP